LALALPGGVYVYQGDELGLAEVENLPDRALQDPVFHRTQGRVRGRDGCRVPLPWSGDRPPYGFSTASSTWLPQPTSWAGITVEEQEADPSSMLSLYRQAIGLRRAFRDVPGLSWLSEPGSGVLDFRRGSELRCVVNISAPTFELPAVPTLWSGPGDPTDHLPRDTAAWFLS
jgi:alpha-glucosidase